MTQPEVVGNIFLTFFDDCLVVVYRTRLTPARSNHAIFVNFVDVAFAYESPTHLGRRVSLQPPQLQPHAHRCLHL